MARTKVKIDKVWWESTEQPKKVPILKRFANLDFDP